MIYRFPCPAPIHSRLLVLALALAVVSPVDAADLAAGQAKAAAVCNVCHGKLGQAVMPSAPNLAGQVPDYLSTQLQNFRSGKRQHEIMSLIAKPLTDEDIANLSAWYGAVHVEVSAPAQ